MLSEPCFASAFEFVGFSFSGIFIIWVLEHLVLEYHKKYCPKLKLVDPLKATSMIKEKK